MDYYEPSLFLNITNLLPDPVVILDRVGTIQWCNAATFKVTQLAKEDLVGNKFTKLSVLKAIDIPRYIKIFASILKGDSVEHYSATWVRKDGTIFESDIQVESITTQEGKKAILVITRDTTKQKEMDKAFRLAQFSIQNTADPVFWFDDEAKIHYANMAACKSLSYSNDELSKMTIHDIDPEFPSKRWPSFIRELKQKSTLTFESTHIAKDRKLYPVEVSVQRLEFEGQVLNFAYVKNIAERKMAEEKILRSEEQNRIIVNSMSDLILIYDDGDFLREFYTSDESLLYLPWEQMKDKKPEEYMPNTIVETHYENTKIVKETGEPVVYEYQLEIRGETRLFQSTMMLHHDKKSIVVAVKEITEKKLAEIALEKSEKRFRELFLNAPVGLFRSNVAGKILECNKMGAKILGYDNPKEAIENCDTIVHYVDPNRQLELYNELSEIGEASNFQIEIIRRDGKHIWIETYLRLYPEEGFLEMVINDITQRKEIEEKLKESEERYRELIENLPGAVGISDLNEKLVMVNPAFCELFGYKEDELIGLKVLDIINPNEHERMLSETEKRKKGDASIYEVQIVRKDDSFRDTKVSAVPQRDDDGHIIGTIALLTDISEIKHVQESLSASEKRLRNLIEQLPLGVAIASFTEHIELVNQAMADMLYQEKEKLIDSNLIDYLEPSYLTKMRNETETRKTGAKSTYDVVMVRTDGVKCNVRVSAAPNYDSQGQVIGSVGVFEDITENKRNESIRAQQESEIDLYGSLLRHDLRNDLGLILSYVEAVQMMMQSKDEEVHSFLESAIVSIERMANLLNGFGRPQDIRQVDIVEFIKEIAEEAEEASKALQINVSYEKDTSDVKIAAGGLLALVFMNLFRNTVQHAGDEPLIEIRVSQHENQLAITVADNGPGVPEEFQDRLFSRDTSSKGEAGGLGLYLSKQIMERTGGTIDLLKDMKGAVFLLTLPT